MHDDPPCRVPGIPGASFRRVRVRGLKTAQVSARPTSPVVL